MVKRFAVSSKFLHGETEKDIVFFSLGQIENLYDEKYTKYFSDSLQQVTSDSQIA